jgi:hypothetical protein
MSLVEIFDHGAPHSWANLRVNNLATDGNLINNGQIVANNSNYLELNGTLTLNDTVNHTIYTIVPPAGTNIGYLIEYTLLIFITGGPDVNRSWSQKSLNSYNVFGGVTTLNMNWSNLFSSTPSGIIAPNTMGQNFNISGTNLQIRVNNTIAGDTSYVNWNIKIYSAHP